MHTPDMSINKYLNKRVDTLGRHGLSGFQHTLSSSKVTRWLWAKGTRAVSQFLDRLLWSQKAFVSWCLSNALYNTYSVTGGGRGSWVEGGAVEIPPIWGCLTAVQRVTGVL